MGELADLIDAALVANNVAGDSGSGNYTDHVWEEGVGKGLTVTPTKGDTDKTLFAPSAGRRDPSNGGPAYYGLRGRIFSANQRTATNAYRLDFSSPSGSISSTPKVWAISLRCVRS